MPNRTVHVLADDLLVLWGSLWPANGLPTLTAARRWSGRHRAAPQGTGGSWDAKRSMLRQGLISTDDFVALG